MEGNLDNTFKDLSIKDKRNEIINLMIKMDLILKQIHEDNLNYREVENYVYNYEDEDDYLNSAYKSIYNLTENFLDYVYSLQNND